MKKSLLYTKLSGKQFNEIYKGIKFLKFLNDDLVHNDFKYKLGSNKDIIPFKPFGKCDSGGLYFCEESKKDRYWYDYGNKIGIIKIPDDAHVYVEENKFKADKLILAQIINFEDLSDDFWIDILPYGGLALRFVKKQTEEICKLAVSQNGFALKYVKEQTEEICKFSVQQNGFALKYVKEQTEEICKFSVQQNGSALFYVKEQTEEICKLAVQRNGYALQFVKNQTEEICKLAVQQNGMALLYVKEQTEEICKLAVQRDGIVLHYVNEQFQTGEICRLAIQQNYHLLKFKKNTYLKDLLSTELRLGFNVAE